MIQDFMKPASIDEAAELKRKYTDSLFFGGGTEINRAGFGVGSGTAISLENLGLGGIGMQGGMLVIGASVTVQELIDSPLVPAVLKKAAGFIYSRSIRNMATIGGNIGANRTDSALIPCLTALSVVVHTQGTGAVPIEEYIAGDKKDLILSIGIPEQRGVCAVRKISRSAASYPVVTAAVCISGSRGKISGAVAAVGGVDSRVVRLSSIEEGITSGKLDNMEKIQNAVSALVAPQSDHLGTSEYKKYICGAAVADCAAECMEAMK